MAGLLALAPLTGEKHVANLNAEKLCQGQSLVKLIAHKHLVKSKKMIN